MSRGPWKRTATTRARKNKTAAARFAPVCLVEADTAPAGGAPLSAAFEIAFPDGLVLRVARDADPDATERLLVLLRRRAD